MSTLLLLDSVSPFLRSIQVRAVGKSMVKSAALISWDTLHSKCGQPLSWYAKSLYACVQSIVHTFVCAYQGQRAKKETEGSYERHSCTVPIMHLCVLQVVRHKQVCVLLSTSTQYLEMMGGLKMLGPERIRNVKMPGSDDNTWSQNARLTGK